MSNFEDVTRELCRFVAQSPTCFHVTANVGRCLQENGFFRLSERERWDLKPGRAYFVTRSGSSLIAFILPEGRPSNYQIIASHSDSPTFKIKESPEIGKAGHYVMLNIEKYGGMLQRPWFDRPLGAAGRVCVQRDGEIRSVLVDSGRDLLLIPSLAIHMDRKANESAQLSVQSDMLPVFGDESASGKFMELVAGLAGTSVDDILGMELFLYDRTPCSVWGAGREYFSSPRLDDQMCAYASVQAILRAREERRDDHSGICVCCIFDNEEVGSGTKQGADSTFFSDVLKRISLAEGLSDEEYMMMLSSSFMLSADNSHAVHPNHVEKADPVNQPFMNHGVVIKWNAAQKYTTDAISASVFRKICRDAGVPVQDYVNHSDIPGGSTLGNISTAHVSVNCVDIGCAQLAMHSPYETAGVKDTQYMIQAMEAFYKTRIQLAENVD